MRNKEELKRDITEMCKSRGIPIPKSRSYEEVKDTVELIKNICPFCKNYVGHDTSVICICELNYDEDNFY